MSERKSIDGQAVESNQSDNPRRRRRRWLRFSLRAAIVAQVALCVWLAVASNAARRQKAAVERVEELGGFVYYDYQIGEDGGFLLGASPGAPQWLRDALGDDLFQTAVFVVFTFDYLGAGTTVGSLVDDDLAILAELPHIQLLSLNGRREITDDGLSYLSGLPHLVALSLDRTNVQGPGLVHLSTMKDLQIISLGNTPITDASLTHLTKLRRLHSLSLYDTPISDSGLKKLSTWQSLEELSLHNTMVTDEGLRYLAEIKTLREVHTPGTRVTEAGRASLRQALPNCEVR